jgi:hypothetical protein
VTVALNFVLRLALRKNAAFGKLKEFRLFLTVALSNRSNREDISELVNVRMVRDRASEISSYFRVPDDGQCVTF